MTTTEAPTKEMESITIQGTVSETPNSSNIQVESFSVETTDSQLGFDMEGINKVIVGTVTFFNKSAMVWIGWGEVEEEGRETGTEIIGDKSSLSQGTGVPTMGPLVVAMPRSKYVGLGSDGEAPCSQLIGGDNEEEMMLGWQMASRLTNKVGWPVFVSSSLYKNDSSIQGFGDDSSLLHAAAMAEKKVGDIILKRKSEI